ncbi:hypothetical protein HELRODRAFT_110482 [Helobdella robusta]|uniref:Uncharacterized protein n=1 Tax=Helobdella robusta TaxID=6412 RepID=T1EF27_HELRO|nr:hypothetical protein HELRODRAFT_110482 [Helobdella robusta]ESO07545.1 hypothetical protein HELRODRAFT_110482 [Helobdella robusta]
MKEMERMKILETKNPNNAIEIENASFGWLIIDADYFRDSIFDILAHRKSVKNSEWSRTTFSLSALPENRTYESEKYNCVLRNININISKGKLVAVIGTIGSGKSSLLYALIGQLKLLSGSMAIHGTIGYVGQEPWIINDTFKENILFGNIYNEKKYNEVIDQCCLQMDLLALPMKQDTVLGERGAILSGGQRQRIGLARAVYSNPDVLLLDDPLSAVDLLVSQTLFDNIFKQAVLRGKTIIFNTNQLQLVSRCDEIIYMKHGRIVEMGNHEVMMESNGEYAQLINTFYRMAEFSASLPDSEDFQSSLNEDPDSNDILKRSWSFDIEDEYQHTFKSSTYCAYIKAAGGVCVAIFIFISFLIPNVSFFINDYWLSLYLTPGFYASNSSKSNSYRSKLCEYLEPTKFMYIYIGIAIFSVISLIFRGWLFVKVTLRAATKLHDGVMDKLMRAPMSFFDVTPVGRLISSFSSGLDGIDVRLPMQLEEVIQNACSVMMCIASVVITFPSFLAVVAFLVIVFYFVQKMSRLVTRQLKRLESSTKSPLYMHVLSTIHGLETIQAFKKTKMFDEKFEKLVNSHISAVLMNSSFIRWMTLRLDILATFSTSMVALLIVLSKNNVSTAMAGLAISYSAQMSTFFQHTVRLITEAESKFISVERLLSWAKNTPQEAPLIITSRRPPDGWPSDGRIVFSNYYLSYQKNSTHVLKNVNFTINPKEKVGIIGRTGSGKSSIVASIFRIFEKTRGSILIDDIDISEIGLYDLRSRLAIVPQEPVLFSGTLRYNLDPFKKYTNNELWSALEKCRIKQKISHLNGQLDTKIIEHGAYFSLGEKQLICLARTLLLQSNILIMDEATSAIDPETEDLIDTVTQLYFSSKTVLTIAHKTKTVMKCDRIMVIDNGQEPNLTPVSRPTKKLRDPGATHIQFLRWLLERCVEPPLQCRC